MCKIKQSYAFYTKKFRLLQAKGTHRQVCQAADITAGNRHDSRRLFEFPKQMDFDQLILDCVSHAAAIPASAYSA